MLKLTAAILYIDFSYFANGILENLLLLEDYIINSFNNPSDSSLVESIVIEVIETVTYISPSH